MKETFDYDDSDGFMRIEVEKDGCEFKYEAHGDLNTISILHCPHNLKDFYEFLFDAAEACRVEYGRQVLETEEYVGRRAL